MTEAEKNTLSAEPAGNFIHSIIEEELKPGGRCEPVITIGFFVFCTI